MILIDPTARVSPLADIEDSTRGTRIAVGARAVVDAFVKIKPAGGAGDVEIGPDCVINSGCVLYTGNGIRMGARVAVAANCTFAPANHEFRRRDLPIRAQGFRPSKGGIVIENDVWIGANCVLLDGAVLREGCVIAAGTIVRGEVAAFSIQGGNPMKLMGWREDTGG
ncbi:acyltransferase [Achromobacter marplatensis]|uniref:acyltransferase n=1 Tax=Achromobacter marplatensis TaxID=470868 RepID=UPI0039F6FFE2